MKTSTSQNNEQLAEKIHTHLVINGGAYFKTLDRDVEVHDILEGMEQSEYGQVKRCSKCNGRYCNSGGPETAPNLCPNCHR